MAGSGIEDVADRPARDLEVADRSAAGGERARAETQMERGFAPPSRVGQRHWPRLAAPAAGGDLTPQVDHPRSGAVGELGLGDPIEGRSLAEGPGIQDDVSQPSHLARGELNREMMEARVAPGPCELGGRGLPPALAQAPRGDKGADGRIKRPAGGVMPASQLGQEVAERIGSGLRCPDRLTIDGAQPAVVTPRAELGLDRLETGEHALECQQSLCAIDGERRQHGAGAHEIRLAVHVCRGVARGPQGGTRPSLGQADVVGDPDADREAEHHRPGSSEPAGRHGTWGRDSMFPGASSRSGARRKSQPAIRCAEYPSTKMALVTTWATITARSPAGLETTWSR